MLDGPRISIANARKVKISIKKLEENLVRVKSNLEDARKRSERALGTAKKKETNQELTVWSHEAMYLSGMIRYAKWLLGIEPDLNLRY